MAEDLFGTTPAGRRNRPAWVIEIAGLGAEGQRSTSVRVTLRDQENGKVVAAQQLPWAWIADVALGYTTSVVLHEGDYS